MKIKTEYIGSQVYSKVLNSNVLILDDPSRFEYYKTVLSVDIFQSIPYKAVSHKRKKKRV